MSDFIFRQMRGAGIMSKWQKRRIVYSIIGIILLLFGIERLYNSRAKFNVDGEDAAHYGIFEAKLIEKEKLKDFEYLYESLEENYPFFEVNKRLDDIDWLGNKKKYRRIVKNTKSDAEFFAAISSILGDLNNDHVTIFDGETYRWYRDYYYNMYASSIHGNHLSMYEAFVNPYVGFRYKVGFEDQESSKEVYEGPALETKIIEEDQVAYMKINEIMSFDPKKKDYELARDFFKEVEDYEKIIIDIRGNAGINQGYWEEIVQLLAQEHLSARYYSFFKDGHRKGALDPYKISGMNIISRLDKDVLKDFPEEIERDFKFYKKFSIHIEPWTRGNDPLEKIDFNGEVYLLVDRHVFSASEVFAAFAKDSGFAKLVGERTGGGMFFEELPIIFLPQTKFAIRYSREMSMNKDGTINMEEKTLPHIEVEDAKIYEDPMEDPSIRAVIND